MSVNIGRGLFTHAGTRSTTALRFLNKLKQRLDALPETDEQHLCIVGDFNMHLSTLDVQGRKFRTTKSAQTLLSMLRDYSLVDVWRDRHPNTRRYTWHRSNPAQGSRIDYAFVAEGIIDIVV